MEDGTRYRQIIERLRQLIVSGELEPGDRLPPERTLAESFGVSRNSVREAIRALAEKGVVESRRGAGTFVAQGDENALAEAFAEALSLERRRLEEVFEFRRMVEPAIAALAAERVTPAMLRELDGLLDRQQELLMTDGPVEDLDASFHRLLAKATGNRIVVDVLDAMHDAVSESRAAHLQTPGRMKKSLESHRAILVALAENNPLAARTAMVEHLQLVEEEAFGAGEGFSENGRHLPEDR